MLKLFLAEGMSVCQNLFKVRSKEVSKVLKNLQVITRYIQNICNYTKVRFYLNWNINLSIKTYFYFYCLYQVIKDNALSNCLPNIRGILEALILKVKNVIVMNGCTDALFMGTMKNMDIKGDEIMSQVHLLSTLCIIYKYYYNNFFYVFFRMIAQMIVMMMTLKMMMKTNLKQMI